MVSNWRHRSKAIKLMSILSHRGHKNRQNSPCRDPLTHTHRWLRNTKQSILFICTCVYISRYISTDLFLIHFQGWERKTPHANQYHHWSLYLVMLNFKKSKFCKKETNKKTKPTSSSKLKRTSFFTAFMGPQKGEKKKDKSRWTFQASELYVA